MNRYENGKIYMIESASAGLIYYGSTCMPLAKRLHNHRNNYTKYKRGKYHFVTSFNVLDNEDHKIILVEEFPCENKQQLFAREAHYIRTMDCVNKVIPNRTHKQYYEDNKETMLLKNKQYREDNKEKLHGYAEHYREINRESILEKRRELMTCECGTTFRKDAKARHYKSNKHQSFTN